MEGKKIQNVINGIESGYLIECLIRVQMLKCDTRI